MTSRSVCKNHKEGPKKRHLDQKKVDGSWFENDKGEMQCCTSPPSPRSKEIPKCRARGEGSFHYNEKARDGVRETFQGLDRR